MKKSIIALFLLTLASQGSSCAAERSTRIPADRRLRPHLQVQELHGKEKHLEILRPRRLGHGQGLTHHEVSTVEIKHPGRTAIGHKGGGGTGGRNMGGGGAMTRPHKSKNGAAALPAPVAFVLALAVACGVALSAFSL